jgi:hypothetical protein
MATPQRTTILLMIASGLLKSTKSAIAEKSMGSRIRCRLSSEIPGAGAPCLSAKLQIVRSHRAKMKREAKLKRKPTTCRGVV